MRRKTEQVNEVSRLELISMSLVKIVGSTFGRIVIGILILALLIGLDLLISGNQMELFSVLFGLELILAMTAAWSFYLLRKDDETELPE